MLDCPVSGTPGMLEAGQGAFFVSGDRVVAESIGKVLEAICPRTTWVGDVGAGAATKSVATALVAIHNLAAAEGLAIAAREGGDIAAVHEAIAGSPAGSAMFEMRGALMAKREYASGGGSLDGYLRGLSQVHGDVSPAAPHRCSTSPTRGTRPPWMQGISARIRPQFLNMCCGWNRPSSRRPKQKEPRSRCRGRGVANP